MYRWMMVSLACAVLLMFGCNANPPAGEGSSENSSADAAGASGISWQSPIEVAEGEAHQGPWQMNDSDFRYVDAPTVALNNRGEANIGWIDQEAQELYFQRFDEAGEPLLDDPVNVSQSPDIFSWLPRIAVDPEDDDRIYLLWQDIVFSGGSHGGEIFFAYSADGGESFGEPVNLSNTQAGAGKGRLTSDFWHNGSLDIAVNGNGDVIAVWTEYEGALRVSWSEDGGESFTEAVDIVSEAEGDPARGPSIAYHPDGTAYVAWTVGENHGGDVWLTSFSEGADNFGEPRVILESDGHADGVNLAIDGEGTLHLVVGQSTTRMLETSVVEYARSTDGGESFTEAKTLAEADGDVGSKAFPALAIDGADRLYVVWERMPSAQERPVSLGFAMSEDRGDSFSAPEVVPGTGDDDLGFNGSLQGLLMQKVAARNEGQVAVVNSTFNQGERSLVRLMRGAFE